MSRIGDFQGFHMDLDEMGGIEALKRMRPSPSLLQRLERMYSVLSSSKRIEILFFLNLATLTPGNLSDLTGMAPNLLSFHLKKLEEAGIVRGEKDGRFIEYSLTQLGRSLSGPLTG
ncbi:MAG: ArsR/SmtB family transcription factor [Thermoplasmatota archaeon]